MNKYCAQHAINGGIIFLGILDVAKPFNMLHYDVVALVDYEPSK